MRDKENKNENTFNVAFDCSQTRKSFPPALDLSGESLNREIFNCFHFRDNSICVVGGGNLTNVEGFIDEVRARDNFMRFSSCETQCKHYFHFIVFFFLSLSLTLVFYDDSKASKHLGNHTGIMNIHTCWQ